MIEQQAQVVAIDNDSVSFTTEQARGCTSCSAKGGCGTSLLAQLFPERPQQNLVLPRVQCPSTITVGERWILAVNEQQFGLMAVWLYLVPLLGLLLGSIVGKAVFELELIVILAGLLGLSGGLLFSRHLARMHEHRLRAAIVVLRKVTPQVAVPFSSSHTQVGG